MRVLTAAEAGGVGGAIGAFAAAETGVTGCAAGGIVLSDVLGALLAQADAGIMCQELDSS